MKSNISLSLSNRIFEDSISLINSIFDQQSTNWFGHWEIRPLNEAIGSIDRWNGIIIHDHVKRCKKMQYYYHCPKFNVYLYQLLNWYEIPFVIKSLVPSGSTLLLIELLNAIQIWFLKLKTGDHIRGKYQNTFRLRTLHNKTLQNINILREFTIT